MKLTPEQIDRLIQQADGLAPKEGSIFRALVKLTEAEVRKQDDALIQQMLEVLENFDDAGPIGEGWQSDGLIALLKFARARLDGKP